MHQAPSQKADSMHNLGFTKVRRTQVQRQVPRNLAGLTMRTIQLSGQIRRSHNAEPQSLSWPSILEVACGADSPVCQLGRLSSRPLGRTGKSAEPAGWKACPTSALYFINEITNRASFECGRRSPSGDQELKARGGARRRRPLTFGDSELNLCVLIAPGQPQDESIYVTLFG